MRFSINCVISDNIFSFCHFATIGFISVYVELWKGHSQFSYLHRCRSPFFIKFCYKNEPTICNNLNYDKIPKTFVESCCFCLNVSYPTVKDSSKILKIMFFDLQRSA